MAKLIYTIKNLDFLSEHPLALPLTAVGIALFLFLISIDLLTSSFRSLNKAKKIIDTRKEPVRLLESQAKALRNHATSYTNTLGGEGARLLAELTDIVEEQEEILNALELATHEWDIEELNRIHKEPVVSDKEIFIDKMKRAETIIGYLSSRLVEASITATKLNLPKINKNNSTIYDLSTAGLFSSDRPEES